MVKCFQILNGVQILNGPKEIFYVGTHYPVLYFSTQQEISCPVLKSGKSLGIFPCIINSGIPVSFQGLRRDGKWASLEQRELDGTGSEPVLNARDQKFPLFPGKKIWYPKTRLGMQTSNKNVIFTLAFIIINANPVIFWVPVAGVR